MKRVVASMVVLAFVALVGAQVGQAATQAEAKGMVEKAIAYWKANGKEEGDRRIQQSQGSVRERRSLCLCESA